MKKSLLTASIIASMVCTAQAATVYDKDGTSLNIGGRVQSVVYNGHYKQAGINDSSLVNSARLSISGQTKVNDWLSAYAFSEWDMADGNKNKIGDTIKAREQYVGADFGSFGKLTAGKTFDVTKKVIVVTDIFEDVDMQNDIGLNGDRRNSMFRYDLNTNGFFASLNFETATDDTKVFGKARDIKSGEGVAIGYTFDDVWFGPLSIKAAYSYIEGQDDASAIGAKRFDNAKQLAGSIAWGLADNGLYLASLFYNQKTNFDTNHVQSAIHQTEARGFELVAGYTFDNGIGLYSGYNHWECTDKTSLGNKKAKFNRVPLLIKYTLNPNFKLWTEAEFDAGSDIDNRLSQYNTSGKPLATGTQLSAGARYTF